MECWNLVDLIFDIWRLARYNEFVLGIELTGIKNYSRQI